MAKQKSRLDKLIVTRGLVTSRAQAQGVILAGEVLVDGQRVDKPGTRIANNAQIVLKEKMPYVGRGGLKLAAALLEFGVAVHGRTCADVGACTGGFTDVLLQNGAARVTAIDVGYGQLNWKLRQDERVTVRERTNARYLENLDTPVSFVCIDVSFISLKLILPAAQGWLIPPADIVALIKPQFEAGRKQVGKGGIIKDSEVHKQVLHEILDWCEKEGLAPRNLMRSPVTGSGGNVEFLVHLQPGETRLVTAADISAVLLV